MSDTSVATAALAMRAATWILDHDDADVLQVMVEPDHGKATILLTEDGWGLLGGWRPDTTAFATARYVIHDGPLEIAVYHREAA